jgi:hypothetical protein
MRRKRSKEMIRRIRSKYGRKEHAIHLIESSARARWPIPLRTYIAE